MFPQIGQNVYLRSFPSISSISSAKCFGHIASFETVFWHTIHFSKKSSNDALTHQILVVPRPEWFLLLAAISSPSLISVVCSRFGRIKLTVRVPGSSGNSVVDGFLAVHFIFLNNKTSQVYAGMKNIKAAKIKLNMADLPEGNQPIFEENYLTSQVGKEL